MLETNFVLKIKLWQILLCATQKEKTNRLCLLFGKTGSVSS